MKKNYLLLLIAFLCAFVSGYGQTEIFNVNGGGTFPTGWTDTNNITGQSIDKGTYYHLEPGNPGDVIETAVYDLSACSSATFEIDITSWGSGTHRSLLVEVSTDGGTSFTQSYTTPITTGSYVTRTINIPTVSANTVLRLSVNATSGRGIRLQDLILTCIAPVGPNIIATPTTITGLDYVIANGPSTAQSFDVTGTLLTLGTTVTSNSSNFEVSLTAGSGYMNAVTIPAGTLNGTTTIYTRLVAGLAINTYGTTIDITNATPGIATTPTITVSGEVTNIMYCEPVWSNSGDSEIESVSLVGESSSISNTSNSCTNAVQFNLSESADLMQGLSYTLTVGFGDCNGGAYYDGAAGVWIDWNNDGDFDDSGEEIGVATISTSASDVVQIENFTINVNAAQTIGDFRMRILQEEGESVGSVDACDSNNDMSYGGVEDYTVSIIAGTTDTQINFTSATYTANETDGNLSVCVDIINPSATATTANIVMTSVTTTHISSYTQAISFPANSAAQQCVTIPITDNANCSDDATYTFEIQTVSGGSSATVGSINETILSVNDNDGSTGIFKTLSFEGSDDFGYSGGGSIQNDFNKYFGTNSYRLGGSDNLTTDNVSLVGISNVTLSVAFASSGADSNEDLFLDISYDNGATWTGDGSIKLVDGYSNANINMGNTNASDPTTVATNPWVVNINPIETQIKVRLRAVALDGSEYYYVDDIILSGDSCTTPIAELQLVDNTATAQNCGYTIDFGTQGNGTNTDLTFDIQNIGSADLDITSFGITGDYTIVSPATPLTITAGNSETVTVRFTPTAINTRTGILTINNNDSNESSCAVNLTGEGFIPVPEIDIERNSGNSIPDGAAANTAYNTIFAATTMGDTSAPKTFHISNEGTADLNVSSLVSSNNAEFAITLNPGASIIAPGTEIDFEITFSPTGVGLRTAVITIDSDDADEASYEFAVQGNGNCAGATLTLSPDNGPVNTIVNVTSSGSNFGASTTASINGIAATVTIIAANEIEVTIPAGANTGSLEINDNIGCLSSSLFTVIDQLISDCEGSTASTPSDIFISEITDHGSGSHSYVELFNGTGVTVDLSDYELRIHGNGNINATGTIALTGNLPNNEVFVVAFGSTESTNNYASHGYDLANNTSGVNSNDPIRLYKNTTTWVDLWGLSDYTGDDFTIATKNYTYRRKNSGITAPSTTWNTNDWDSFAPVDYSDIGNYDFSVGVPPIVTTQPTDPNSDCDLTATLNVTADEGFAGGNPLAYQWYYSAPGDTSWTAATNGAIYAGATSNTLNILNTLTLNDYQYYCQVRENTATCYTASNSVRIKSAVTTWDGTDWTNSTPPDINTIAIIDGDYNTITEGSFSACQLTVNAGNQLVIAIGDYVEVANNVDVYGNGTGLDGILVEDKGSFVQHGDGVNAGTYTLHTNAVTQVNKRTAPLNNYYEYTYWSSPVLGETIGNGLLEAHPTRRFWYDGQNYLDRTKETGNNNATVTGQDDIDDNGDDWQFTSNTDIMQPGIGYAAMHSQTGFGMPGANYEYTFEGALHTGDYNVPIYRNDLESLDNNWNFIGNPYASAIDADAFLAVNTNIDTNVSETTTGVTDGAIFLWSQNSPYTDTNNGNQVLNFAQSDYAVINGTGQTSGGDGVMPTRHIPSGQGFFISLSDAATTTTVSGTVKTADVTFNNSMRVTGNNNQFFRTENSNPKERLWINLTSDNGIFNQVLIGYIPGATHAYDGMYYDAPKNLSAGSHSILYSIIDDANGKDKLAIQGKSPESLHLDEVIPLGFKTSIDEATIYNFSIAQIEGAFLTENTIYVHDKLMQIFHDLSEAPYTFTSETGEHNDRFDIVFKDTALSIPENELNNAFTIIEQQDGTVKFSTSNGLQIKNVKVYDVLGRLLYNLNGNSSTETYNLDRLSQAAYLAKVTLSNDVVLTKKAIKRN